MKEGVNIPILDNTNTAIGNWNAIPQANVKVATVEIYELMLI
jgi:hypothetical protein